MIALSELMVGNLVCYDGDVDYSNPIRVEGFDIGTDMLVTSDREDVGSKGVIPIPLTRDKLEENGVEFHFCFDFDTASPFEVDISKARKFVQIFGNNNNGFFTCEVDDSCADGLVLIATIYGNTTEIRYWHELQNALTVCKIKKDFELC